MIRVIGPCVSVRFHSTREIDKYRLFNSLLAVKTHEFRERIITLVHPVTVRVGHDVLELEAVDALGIRRLLELFLTRQIVVYCGEVNLALALMLRLLDENHNGDGGAAALSKDLAAFLSRLLTDGALIPLQMPDVDRAEFFGHALAHAVGTVGVDPTRIRHEANDTLFANAVRSPTVRTNVGIVKRVLKRRLCSGCIGFCNTGIEFFVMLILIVIIGTILPNRVRRVADNHANVRLKNGLEALVVLCQRGLEEIRLRVVGKRVRPDENLVRLILRRVVNRATLVENRLKIHGRDVVRQRHNLAGVKLVLELRLEFVLRDESGFD